MKKVLIEMKVASLEAAKKFYCDELALFEVRRDYGMGTISLAYTANETILLLLSEGTPAIVDRPVFSLEVESCERIFHKLRSHRLESGATLLNAEIFEYPLERNLTLQDPSGNRFLIFEPH